MKRIIYLNVVLLLACVLFCAVSSAETYTKNDIQFALQGEWIYDDTGVLFDGQKGAVLATDNKGNSYVGSYGSYVIDVTNQTITLRTPCDGRPNMTIVYHFTYNNKSLKLKDPISGKYFTKTVDRSTDKKFTISFEETFQAGNQLWIGFWNNYSKNITGIDAEVIAFDRNGILIPYKNKNTSIEYHFDVEIKAGAGGAKPIDISSARYAKQVDKIAVRIVRFTTSDGKSYKLNNSGFTWQLEETE